MAEVDVAGFADGRFAGLFDLLHANLSSGDDIGASFCATLDGEVVVDLWGGHADEAQTRPWRRDTICLLYTSPSPRD